MSVSLRWDEPKQHWQVHWRSAGKRSLYVPASAFAGDKGAAERVASRLKARVNDSADKGDASSFWRVKDQLIGEERASCNIAVVTSDAAVPVTVSPCTSAKRITVPVSPSSDKKCRRLAAPPSKRLRSPGICHSSAASGSQPQHTGPRTSGGSADPAAKKARVATAVADNGCVVVARVVKTPWCDDVAVGLSSLNA